MRIFLFYIYSIIFFSSFLYANILLPEIQKIPSFKIYCLIEFYEELKQEEIKEIKNLKIKIFNLKVNELQNKKKSIIKINSKDFYKLKKLKFIKNLKVITKYIEKGIYELQLEIKEEDEKKLNKDIEFIFALPRSSQWKKIILMNYKINKKPKEEKKLIDETNNNWLIVVYNNLKKYDKIFLISDFSYEVDLKKLIKSNSYNLQDNINISSLNRSEFEKYLIEGNKIIFSDTKIFEIITKVKSDNIKEMNNKIKKYIKKNIKYDYEKREKFFGGKMIYTDLLEMHQDTLETIKRKIGACPDTCELETALFRACGVPARPVGRVGHFYSQFYLPNYGWVNTSVITDEIFLYEANNNDECSFANWNNNIKVQIKKWNGYVQFEKIIELE